MNIRIDSSLALKLGFLCLEDCNVAPSSDELLEVYAGVVEEAKRRFAGAALTDEPLVGDVRRLFKSVGIDPSRYRASSEALLRRIVKDQELYYINALVDINNICSIESLLPIGSYDHERISGDVTVRIGTEDESYQGIGREINISGKLVGADNEGPFGSPIADSDRTKVAEQTRQALVLVYAPPQCNDDHVERTLQRYGVLAAKHAGARPAMQGIVAA
jgi:DNA/RNA-binding domain of Phe-tRNA-synthetase-like protein